MPKIAADLTNQVFDRLTVVGRAQKRGRQSRWLCRCQCGTEKVIQSNHLKSKEVRSCGCLLKDFLKENPPHMKHGETNTRLFNIYHQMKRRCYDTTHINYKNYGGRGILICDEWINDYTVFAEWARSNGYSDDLTLDRRDNSRGYSPDNCRFATITQQNRNKRTNVTITINGITHCISEWAEITGLHPHTIGCRYRSGTRGTDLLLPTSQYKYRRASALSSHSYSTGKC